MRRTVILAAVLALVSCQAAQVARASTMSPAATALNALAESPEARTAALELRQETEKPAVLGSLRSFLAHYEKRLTAFQASFLRLGTLILSPSACCLP